MYVLGRRAPLCFGLILVVLAMALMIAPAHAKPRAVWQSLEPGPTGRVVRVVDGDTLEMASGRHVRLVGLSAPELNGAGGPELGAFMAHKALEDIVLGHEIQLFYGGAQTDRYGRALAHIWRLKNGQPDLWVQAALLRAGAVRVYSFDDNRALVAEMRAAEATARQHNKGLWAHPFYAIQPAEAVTARNRFTIVEGTVKAAKRARKHVFLDFGEDWQTDFSVRIATKDLKRFGKKQAPLRLEGKRVRVRGWVFYKNGPSMQITHPEAIEILAD